LFKGTFYHCVGTEIRHIKNKTHCLSDGNHWINRKYNFDDLGQALMALFVLASKDGWVEIMYHGLDAVGVDIQPRTNYNEWLILYFVSFLLIVGFFVLNMFVGVVVENFHKCREEQAAEELRRKMEKRQRKLEKARQKAQETPYYELYSRPRRVIHDLIMNKYFDLLIAAIIGLNVISMALEYYNMPKVMIDLITFTNYVFTGVFILEALLKIFAQGVVRYFRDRWNQLDMLIVILSIVGIVLEEMESNFLPINPTIIRIMRVLRIARGIVTSSLKILCPTGL
ncbi:voltage-dependent T-type calcium channel subunit alpha-1I-like, partial [Saccoglossus kowalevskii]|uniref:Voltage-dependent T-type calcium channel subunit alpha-1I-like n=1 Tax=Saccoglossus kowalevskii TaxID=10224 RepID=A0ABM0GXB6_SACKO